MIDFLIDIAKLIKYIIIFDREKETDGSINCLGGAAKYYHNSMLNIIDTVYWGSMDKR